MKYREGGKEADCLFYMLITFACIQRRCTFFLADTGICVIYAPTEYSSYSWPQLGCCHYDAPVFVMFGTIFPDFWSILVYYYILDLHEDRYWRDIVYVLVTMETGTGCDG